MIGEQTGPFAMTPRQAPIEHDIAAGSARDPEITLGGAAAFLIRVVAFDRSFVRLHVASGEQVGVHAFIKRFAPLGGEADPFDHALLGNGEPHRADICSRRKSGLGSTYLESTTQAKSPAEA
jgi:hypothetical protein